MNIFIDTCNLLSTREISHLHNWPFLHACDVSSTYAHNFVLTTLSNAFFNSTRAHKTFWLTSKIFSEDDLRVWIRTSLCKIPPTTSKRVVVVLLKFYRFSKALISFYSQTSCLPQTNSFNNIYFPNQFLFSCYHTDLALLHNSLPRLVTS